MIACARAEREVIDALATTDPYARHGLWSAVEAFRELVGAERALAYRPLRSGAAWELDLAATAGWSDDVATTRVFSEAFPRVFLRRFGLFDPIHPEPGQRNRPLRFADLRFDSRAGTALSAPIHDLYRRVGVHRSDQLRILLCDGPRLVAWIGGWRDEPFTVAERERLRRATHALRQRMQLEARLLHAGVLHRALEATLEQWTAPAALIDEAGRVVHRNAAARSGDLTLLRQMRTALSEPHTDFELFPLRTSGLRRHTLVVRRKESDDRESRLVGWVERYGLTPRQTDVLQLLVEGCNNREISERLGVAKGTAELHVSAVLGKVGVSSRARLLTRLGE